jgi:hypothetical protein
VRFFSKAADGGKDSGVTGYFLIEIKPLFSIVLLHFRKGTRDAYHSHAFNAWTWWIKGSVIEHVLRIGDLGFYQKNRFRSGDLKYTTRANMHKVEALEDTWALSLRGPWVDRWQEFRFGKLVTLTHGRKEVSE